MTLTNQINSPNANPAQHAVPLPRHILIGYWHNWHAQPTRFIRLKDISRGYDVINVAFATSKGDAAGSMTFEPCAGTSVEEFKADIAALHRLGKKIVISAGGANGSAEIADQRAQENFVASMSAIIREYGFDGIDINLERKVILEAGDRDFKRPTSPSITNLVAAIRKIRDNFCPDFIVSMAPETVCVQGGFATYGGVWGSYLPVIDALRDILTYVHVQHYNSGTMLALDGQNYSQGTADFHVAMAEMLLHGFPINGDPANVFPMLRPEQIAIGLPALANAANAGYTVPAEVQKALNYLTMGQPFGGHYALRCPEGYPGLRGVMTWSINWDATSSQQFSSATRSYLDMLLYPPT